VSVYMGYNGLDDLIKNERPDEQPDRNLKDTTDDIDLSLACKKFPSITLGSSPPVELYDETISSSRIRGLLAAQSITYSMEEKWVDPDGMCETWPSLCQPLSETASSILVEESTDNLHQSSSTTTFKSEGETASSILVEESTDNLHQSSSTTTFESEGKSDNLFVQESTDKLLQSSCFTALEGKSDHLVIEEDSSSKVEVVPQLDAATLDLFLDRSISCIPGLSKRHSRQLEECGFYT
ncbi:ATP-dependent DNA helicase recG-like protein, partial [Corchorus olitorius]